MHWIRKVFWLQLGLIGSAFVLAAVWYSMAADATLFSDALSNQQVGQPADHTIQFTTPSGVLEGEVMTVTFPGLFVIGSVDYTDIDVDAGGDLTVWSDCSLSHQVSASFAGNVMMLTVCPGDGGAIAPGSIVHIKIGLNALFGVAGDAQITNPGVANTYAISLGGTFADSGTAYVAVMANNSVSVNAVVVAPGRSGGLVNNTMLNDSPPIISNVQVTAVTDSSATITWQTDELSTSVVEYGLTAAYGSSESIIAMTTSHQIVLTGLEPGTLYHFQVISRDSAGAAAILGDFTFTTAEIPGIFLNLKVLPEKRLPRTGNWSNDVRVQVFSPGTASALINEMVSTNATGIDTSIPLASFTLPETVDITVKGTSHLRMRKSNVVLTPSSDLIDFSNAATSFERAGDTNGTEGDNYVNGMDLSRLGSTIYSDIPRYDLNRDGIVNGVEFGIAVANLYEWGDP